MSIRERDIIIYTVVVEDGRVDDKGGVVSAWATRPEAERVANLDLKGRGKVVPQVIQLTAATLAIWEKLTPEERLILGLTQSSNNLGVYMKFPAATRESSFSKRGGPDADDLRLDPTLGGFGAGGTTV